ncbi:MAG: 1-acyl-sn-glycerol-3-phosphate acyltransferase [Desulfomonile tiedjei]|nr:1-acyl-sn-glycerol-3-phosphate acyltransferase [Desulfomonile tiedjei]
MLDGSGKPKELKVLLSLHRVLRIALTALGLVVITGVLAPPLMLIGLITSSGRLTYRMMRWWAWGVSKCMGITFSLIGAEKVVPGQSYIVTPNHQSYADVLALVSVLPVSFRWVIKKELLKVPLFGGALAATGAISLDRSNRTQSVQRLRAGAEKLKGGWSVLIYPEGTRTPDGHLQSFKKGAFMMAVQTGMPILPVTSNGAHKVLPRKTLWFRPGHITVTIGDSINTEGLTENDVPELMEKTRQAVAKNLDVDYDPFAASRAPGIRQENC